MVWSLKSSADIIALPPLPCHQPCRDYTLLAKALHNGQGKLWTPEGKVTTAAQLAAALEGAATEGRDCCCFIEVSGCLDR